MLTHEGDDCLIWPFAKTKFGYAVIGDKSSRTVKIVSHLVCVETKGPPPTHQHEAAHSCGRGRDGCVTKQHLTWKTRAENEADKITHGTFNHARGEDTGRAKLTEAQVRDIRALNGIVSQRKLAERFGIGQTTIAHILHRKTWAWLDPQAA